MKYFMYFSRCSSLAIWASDAIFLFISSAFIVFLSQFDRPPFYISLQQQFPKNEDNLQKPVLGNALFLGSFDFTAFPKAKMGFSMFSDTPNYPQVTLFLILSYPTDQLRTTHLLICFLSSLPHSLTHTFSHHYPF